MANEIGSAQLVEQAIARIVRVRIRAAKIANSERMLLILITKEIRRTHNFCLLCNSFQPTNICCNHPWKAEATY